MATRRPHICVVGSTNVDLTFRTARLPHPGETISGYDYHIGCGGKGGNQAVIAARLGGHVTLISRVGHDEFGEMSLRNYREQAVDTTFVTVDADHPTGTAAIIVDDQGQNCIIVAPGANQTLMPKHIREASDAIRSAEILICQLEVPIESVLEAFRIARAAGVRMVLNPAPAKPLPDEIWRLTDWCVPNEVELESLTSRSGEGLDQIAAAARVLQSRGTPNVVVTLGARGALVVTETATDHVPALAVSAIDTTGAGDAFIGSLCVFLAMGVTISEAVKKANAVAALTVTRVGAQPAFPQPDELAPFLP